MDAIFYVAATGCQWRALPACYPNWNTVHRYHLTWSRDGTWEQIAAVSLARSANVRAAKPWNVHTNIYVQPGSRIDFDAYINFNPGVDRGSFLGFHWETSGAGAEFSCTA